MQYIVYIFKLGFPTQVDFTCAQFRNNCAQIKATQFRPTFLRLCFNFLIN